MSIARIEDAICDHICEREPGDPATYADLVDVALGWLPSLSSEDLNKILDRMLSAGKIKSFEEQERGAVYVRIRRGCALNTENSPGP